MAELMLILALVALLSSGTVSVQDLRCTISGNPTHYGCFQLPDLNSNYSLGNFYTGPSLSSEGVTIILDSLQLDGLHQICLDLIRHLTCIISNPPCDGRSGLPLRICDESCVALNKLVSGTTCDRLNDVVFSTGLKSLNVLRDVYSLLDCSDVSTYFFDPNETVFFNGSCTNLFSAPNQASILSGALDESSMATSLTGSTATEPFPVVAIAVPVAIFGSLTLVVVVVVSAVSGMLCWRRSERKKVRMQLSEIAAVNNLEFNIAYGYMAADIPEEDEEEFMPLDQGDKVKYQRLFGSKVCPYRELEVGECIGQGEFGKVFKGMLWSGSKQRVVAIKTLRNFSSKDAQREFFAESLIMKDFKHPNVLELIGVCLDSPDPYLVLPFMGKGSLKEYLTSKRVHATDFETLPKDIGVKDLLGMCVDIIRGMSYLAGQRFVHRDLAARNCMVSDEMEVKVSDFGLARDVYSRDYYRLTKNAKLPVKWLPPETLHDGISNEKTDVWAYGVTCWEVFSLGRTPYPGVPNYDILTFLSKGKRLQRPALCPEELFGLLSLCWIENPEERPDFSEISAKLDMLQKKEL